MEEARGSEKKPKKSTTPATTTKTKTTVKKASAIHEKSISSAMRARVDYFKDQADSLTLEGVRRVLEKDLGLDKYALDAHKRFIKECLQECFEAGSNENVSKSSGETGEEVINSMKEETLDLSDNHLPDQTPKELEDKEEAPVPSPIAGVDIVPDGTKKTEGLPREKATSEETVKNSIRKRAAYFRNHSETLTLVGVRRLLEQDLKLDEHALDPYRELIKDQLDKVLQSSDVTEPANGSKNKKRKNVTSGGDSDSSDSVDEMEDEEVKPKKISAPKQKMNVSGALKNRKGPSKEIAKGSNKRKKPAESISEETDNAKDGGDLSDDGQSQSSNDKTVKKRSEASTQVYGKHVEHLRSVIRSCNLSIPPNVYKRVKQESESKREACLVKELEDILRKEGLSTNPSEKEKQEVRKQKERTKELEGIDLSNIVSSSRRRSTSSFVPPPKPKITSETESESEDEDDDDGDDGGNDDDNADETDDEGPDDSNSEESNEDVDDDSD